MPKTVTLETAGKNKAKLKVEDNGQIIFNQVVAYATPKGIATGTNICGIDAARWQAETANLDSSSSHQFTVDDNAPVQQEPFVIYIRGLRQTKDQQISFQFDDDKAGMKQVLKMPETALPFEAIISWDDITRCCAGDMDTHHIPDSLKPTDDEIRALMSRIQPQPEFWFRTAGGGIRFFFFATPEYTAEQLAVMCALAIKSLDQRFTIEVKTDSRHPACIRADGKRAGPVFYNCQTSDMSIVSRWMSKTVDPDAIKEWCEQHDYQPIKRYPHSRCLIDPNHKTDGTPVFIGDYGIHCDSCQSHGTSYKGSRKPGFVSWGQVLGGMDSRLIELVKNWVHFGHAKYILPHLIGETNEKVIRVCYRTLLQFYHGKSDIRIDMVFTAADVLRFGTTWYREAGLSPVPLNMSTNIVRTFPATVYVKKNAIGVTEVKNDPCLVDTYRIPGDIDKFGYYNLFPIRGMDLWGVHLEYPANKFPFHLPNTAIDPDKRPKYVPKNKRMSIETAMGHIEKVLPGIDFNYFGYCIAALAFVQGNDQILLTFVSGYSGSGKSTIPLLAAAAVGQAPVPNPFVANWERYRQGIIQALDNTQLFITNEIEKDCQKYKITPKAAFDSYLSLEFNSYSHILYQGAVKIHRGFAQFATDISLNREVKADIQHGRRWVYIHLNKRLPDWKRTLNLAGVSQPALLRNHSGELADALDAYVSHILDEHFRSPRVWEDIADSFGYKYLMNTSDYKEQISELRRFFELVCSASEITGALGSRLPGRGWKAISKDYTEKDELSEAWGALADNRLDKWFSSNKILAEDWNAVMSVPHKDGYIIFEAKKFNDKTLFVRFKGDNSEQPTRVNSELVARLPTGSSGVD